LEGYFADERYFVSVEREIRECFSFKLPLEENNKRFMDRIKGSESVSVHIRRGEYVHSDFFELLSKGIGTRLMYPPINKQKAYNLPGDYPISNLVGEKGLWLPSASQLTDEEIAYITATIKDYYLSK